MRVHDSEYFGIWTWDGCAVANAPNGDRRNENNLNNPWNVRALPISVSADHRVGNFVLALFFGRITDPIWTLFMSYEVDRAAANLV